MYKNINLCTLIAYSLMTPQERKKKKKLRTGCFCKIVGTISNAIDVFSSFSCMSSCFRVRFLSLESDLQTESESVL